jgi:hypothetical protein
LHGEGRDNRHVRDVQLDRDDAERERLLGELQAEAAIGAGDENDGTRDLHDASFFDKI